MYFGMGGTLITVAPTGAESSKSSAPALPVSFDELLQAASRCESLGASVIHVHLRDKQGRPTMDLVYAKEVVTALRERTELIIQISTGGAVTDSEKARLQILDSAPDMASLTCGTVNFGSQVFQNRWPFMVDLYQKMNDLRIMPEFELFDLGHVASMTRLLEAGGAPARGHIHVDLVMGVPGGMPATPQALVACVDSLPAEATLSATGVGRRALPVMLASLAVGGHLRVGMEDTLTHGDGSRVKDNAQLVQRASGLAVLAQRPALSCSESRKLLGLEGGEASFVER